MKKLLLILLFTLIVFILPAPTLDVKSRSNHVEAYLVKIEQQKINIRIKEIENKDFKIELLFEYMQLIDSSFNDVVIRQFILETGWFKSYSFTEYNNIAGMKLAKVRNTTAVGEALGHAKYNHWTCSVQDYILWRNYYTDKGYNTEDYYAFLKEIGYATYKYYNSRLKSINLKKYEFTKDKTSSCC